VIRSIRDVFTTSRTKILSKLEVRPHTISELAKVTGYSKSTLSYHLEKLSELGMVKRIENDRKWVYYELTERGKRTIRSDMIKLLGLLLGGIGSMVYAIYRVLSPKPVLYEVKVTETPKSEIPIPSPAERIPVPSPTEPTRFEIGAYDPYIGVLLGLGVILILAFLIYRRKR
jgi:DNA-binding transcriptional ArsR family regulator